MKPETKLQNHQTTAQTDGVRMSIDVSAMAHIMDVLTKLYGNPRLAILREYSTNALDSHIEAGNTDPIRVTLPTKFDLNLTIHDHGVGMDAEDIVNTYSRYGTSTKRESNEAVGMLGLGCKSALAYGEQFTLTGYKNGRCIQVLISRGEDGVPTMNTVDEYDTDEADGVTVTIPIRAADVDDLQDEAAAFFRYWTPGTVLVDGNQPNRIGHNEASTNLWLNDNILLTNEVDESIVVMGNVPYPLVDGEAPLFSTGSATRYSYGTPRYNAVCFVPIGAVNFAPSREGLMDTPRTKAAIKQLRQTILDLRDQSVLDQIAAAPDAKTAQEILRTGKQIGFNPQTTPALWQGREVVLSLIRERPKDAQGNFTISTDPDAWSVEQALEHSFLIANHNHARKTGDRTMMFDLSTDAIVFENFDGKTLTPVKREKLEIFLQREGHYNAAKVMFVDKLSKDERFWLSGHTVEDWEDVACIKLATTTAADGSVRRLKGSYKASVFGTREPELAAAKIDQTKPIYWLRGNEWTITSHSAVRNGAIDLTTCTVVALGENRIDKFKRDFPTALYIEDAAKAAAERWVKTQDKETTKAYAIQRGCEVDNLKRLDATKLDDPDLREVHRLAKLNVTAYTNGRSKFNRYLLGAADDTGAKWAEKVLAKYPLYATIGTYHTPNADHLALYLNAAYAQQKGV